jgi:CubicO group peptidase (beta-lactamase class C family)
LTPPTATAILPGNINPKEPIMSPIRKTTVKFLAVLLFFALPPGAAAQTVKPEEVGLSSERLRRVNEMVQRYIAAGDISGAVTLVARDGKIAHLEAQGVVDITTKKPMAKDTIFRIASMSKPVAGVAVMMLVEEGKVRLTDPVSRFIPGFRGQQVAVAVPGAGGARGSGGGGARGGQGGQGAQAAAPAPGAQPAAGGAGGGAGGRGNAPPPAFTTVPAQREITIKDLLTHTSGLMSGTLSNAGARGAKATRQANEGLVWTERLGASPLEFQPGTRWAYSALAGFDVLSHVVEIASGQTFDQFLKQRIFEPLRMRDIFFWPDAAQRERLVSSYTRGENGLQPRNNPDSMSSATYFSGAGGLMTSAQAYAQFGMMLASKGELNGRRILSPRSVELMGSAFIPDTLPGRPAGEGFGLSVRVVTSPAARNTYLSQGSFGWSGAYGTHFFVDPEKKLVGILMIQTPINAMRADFESAVMQAVMD